MYLFGQEVWSWDILYFKLDLSLVRKISSPILFHFFCLVFFFVVKSIFICSIKNYTRHYHENTFNLVCKTNMKILSNIIQCFRDFQNWVVEKTPKICLDSQAYWMEWSFTSQSRILHLYRYVTNHRWSDNFCAFRAMFRERVL